MIFSNRQNERVELPDGRVIWLSRSVAVVVTVWFKVNEEFYLLLGKRGPGCPDEVGKWNLPCGYLDWDEDLQQACLREVWEETGLNLDNYLNQSNVLIDQFTELPWAITSHKRGENAMKQNVSHHYGVVIEVDQLPKLSSANCEPGEIADLQWLSEGEIESLDYAFNHKEKIYDFLKKFNVFGA